MKVKQLVLAVALATPFMAQADLKAMDDSALADVTGQAGISISADLNNVKIGRVAYNDDVNAGGGSINIVNTSITGLTFDEAAPLKIDVVTLTDGATKAIGITLPTINGTVSVDGIYVGGTYASNASDPGTGTMSGAGSLGGLTISDMNLSGSTIKVWGH